VKIPASPFLVPPSSAVRHGDWLLRTPSGDAPLPRELLHWDYQTTLELAAPVSVDRRAVTEACDLAWESGIAILVMVRSDRTNCERMATRLELPMRENFDLAVELELPGETLGGRLTLETLLVAVDPLPTSVLGPQHAGSILWRQAAYTHLEGVGSQFPTDAMDFAAAGMSPHAAWQFKIDITDPDARFMASARLTLNSGHPAIVKLLAGTKDPVTEQLMRTLNWDVTRQMAMAAIGSDDVQGLEPDVEASSVAGVLRNLLARVWPTQSTATLRQWLVTDPSRIELALQSAAKVVK